MNMLSHLEGLCLCSCDELGRIWKLISPQIKFLVIINEYLQGPTNMSCISSTFQLLLAFCHTARAPVSLQPAFLWSEFFLAKPHSKNSGSVNQEWLIWLANLKIVQEGFGL